MDTKKSIFSKNFIIIALGQLISLFGNSLQRFALSLYILDLTGSATIFSLILSIAIVPQILLAPFGGAIADRFDRKKIMIILDAFSGCILLVFTVVPGLTSNVWFIAVLMCLLAVIQSIYMPSVRAAIPTLVNDNSLTSANSITSVIESLANLFGPIAAGLIYGIFGIKVVLIVNIVSFLFSAGMECFLTIKHVAVEIKNSILKTFVGDIKDSFHFISREKKMLLYIILVAAGMNLILAPIYVVGVPYIEKIIFGVTSQMYGFSEAFVGLGMILGAILTPIIAKKLPLAKIHILLNGLTILILGMGITTLPALLNPDGISVLSYVIFTAIGFVFAIILANINITCMTFMQKETPNEYMGKVMALTSALCTALMPVGQIIFGFAYTALSGQLMVLYIITAALTVLATIATHRLLHGEEAAQYAALNGVEN